MHRLTFLTALLVLLIALLDHSDRLHVLANHQKHATASASATAFSRPHHAVPRIRAKRLQELLADQRAQEAGSRRQQEQIARIRQQTAGNNRRGGQDYTY